MRGEEDDGGVEARRSGDDHAQQDGGDKARWQRCLQSMPPTTPTMAFVPMRTCRLSPCQGPVCVRRSRTSSASRRRRAVSASGCSEAAGAEAGVAVVGKVLVVLSSPSDGITIMNDSSVSMCAEREFRFVEPKSVSTGGSVGVGETQMPVASLVLTSFASGVAHL